MPTEVLFMNLGLFLAVAYISFVYISARHKERMALIETGQSAELFNRVSKSSYEVALKWGLVFLFLGLAIAIGLYIDMHYDNNGPVATLPAVAIGTGLGFLVYYGIMRSKSN